MRFPIVPSILVFLLTGCASTKQQTSAVAVPYPFDVCAVAQTPLKEKTYRRVHDGQELLFCCFPCLRVFNENPDLVTNNVRDKIKVMEEKKAAEAGEASADVVE